MCDSTIIPNFEMENQTEWFLDRKDKLSMFSKDNNSTSDYFSGLFENGPSITVGVIFSIILTLFIIPILLSVIWYEKFGSDKKRTILNKLVASVCWSAIHYSLLGQVPELIRYCFGPLPTTICYMHFVIKNVLAVQMILLYNAMTFMRYLFIFWLKNPFRFCDEFWTTYLNIWILSFSLISQTAHAILPGNYFLKLNAKKLKVSFKKKLQIFISSFFAGCNEKFMMR